AKKTVPPKEPAKALLAEAPLTEALDTPEQARPGQAFQAEVRSVPELLEGLSPLQQGFVWAEILGPAKALQD
ncbi:MAG: hypothetical protein LBS57_10260, partial [Treponema sp.]|nr:hypothetical protein [Treponema sp.]